MSSSTITAAASVLPVIAPVAAAAAAFVAFAARRQGALVVSTRRAHTVAPMGGMSWIGDDAKRSVDGTSYVPQSRGSTG